MQAVVDATALMLSKDASTLTPDADHYEGDRVFQCDVQSHGRDRHPDHADLYVIGRRADRRDGSGQRSYELHEGHGHFDDDHQRIVDRAVGKYAAARRAGAGHHGIDVGCRQDGRAQGRNQESVEAIAGCRRKHRRRLRVHHPVQQERQSRFHKSHRHVDRLDRLGSRARRPESGQASQLDEHRTGFGLSLYRHQPRVRLHDRPGQQQREDHYDSVDWHLQGLYLPERRQRQARTPPRSASTTTAATTARHTPARAVPAPARATPNCSCTGSGSQEDLQAANRLLRARLDQERAQHLERLRHRSRRFGDPKLGLRSKGHGTEHKHPGFAVSGGTKLLLLARW